MADHLSPKQRIMLRWLKLEPEGRMREPDNRTLLALERKGFARHEVDPAYIANVRWFATDKPAP